VCDKGGEVARWTYETIWCLHDEGEINPKYIDVTSATTMVKKETKSMVLNMDHNKVYTIFR